MIQVESKLFVADNSGAKLVLCIKILGSTKKRYANIGDLIKVTIKKCLFKSKVKKGGVYNAIVVRTVKGVRRNDGACIRFSNNSVVLLDDKFNFIGTRVFGPIGKEIKCQKYMKIVSLAYEII